MTSEKARFFDSHARGWDCSEPPDMNDRLRRVTREADVRPGMQVLDVGTGTGVLIPHLIDGMQGRGRVTAIDISSEMLSAACERGFPNCVEFLLVSMEEFQCPESTYDRVLCNAVFPHFEDRDRALRRAFHALKPGGVLVISHPKGREAVNRIHREAGEVVAEDRVPAPESMLRILRTAGFVDPEVIDEPEFYLARAAKPPAPR